MERKLTTCTRSRYAALVTYCHAPLVERRLQELVKGGVVRFYAFIEHDRDTVIVDDCQQLKKRHIHVVLNSTSPMRQTAFMQLFAHLDIVDGLEQNTIANVITKEYLNDRVRYLCHLDDKDKYQYSIDDVYTNNAQTLANCMQSYIPAPHDDFMQMLADVLTMNMAQFASVYGRDGVLNYGKYRSYAIEARQQIKAHELFEPVFHDICSAAFNEYDLYSILESNRPDCEKMTVVWNIFCKKTNNLYSSTQKNLSLIERNLKK